MGSLDELINSVLGGTGADRKLDAQIVAALNDVIVKPYPLSDDFGPHDRFQFWSTDGKHFLGSERKFPVHAFTSDITAVLALREERLPDWGATFDVGHDINAATVEEKDDDDEEGVAFTETHADPLRAALAAILRAIDHQSA